MARKFFREYIFKLVVGVAVTGTVTILALINKLWTWPNAVVGGVLLLSGALYLTDRFGIGPSLKSRVRDWLDSSGFGVRSIQDSNEFHFVLRDNFGMETGIIQSKPDSPIKIVSPRHMATPEQIAAFQAMSELEQRNFWKVVRLELLRYGVEFSNLVLDGNGVSFSDNVVAGRSLTAADFLKRVMFVRSAGRLYWELRGNLYDHSQSHTATNPTSPQDSIPETQSLPPSQE